jgi:hypothetical protein
VACQGWLQGWYFPDCLGTLTASICFKQQFFYSKVYAAHPGICSSFLLIGDRSMHHRHIVTGDFFNAESIKN